MSAGAVRAQMSLLEKLTVEQGLSQGFVPSIAQDDDGFLWFGTKNGLNRYDGYGFQVFKNDPFDALSLPNNEVLRVVSAGDFLFLVSNAQEASLFHRKTNRFFNIPDFGEPNVPFHAAFLAGERSVCAIFEKEKTFKIKLIRWPADLAERKNLSAHFEVKTMANLPDDLFDARLSSDKKKLLLLASDRFLVRDLEKGTTSETPIPPLLQQVLPEKVRNFKQNGFWESSDGAFWVFRNNRLARFDGREWRIFSLPFLADQLLSIGPNAGFLWFQSGPEIVRVDLKKQPFDPQPTLKLAIDETIKSAFTDDFGNVWFGTDARGILKFSPRTALFKNYLDGFSVYCQPVFNGKNHVVLTDLRRGNWSSKLLDLRDGSARDLADFRQKDSGWNHSCATENGFFWLLDSEMDGKKPVLTRFEPETGRREAFPISIEIDLSQSILRAVGADQIWIITPNQLVRFDRPTSQFSFFENQKTATDGAMRAVERSPDGTWWIGATTGLIKAEPTGPNSFLFSKMTAEKGNRNSLATNSIKSLLVDPANPDVLWIGTDGLGMSRFDTKKGQFQHFSTRNGLPDGVVYGILADDETPRRLWISTNRGLSRFSPESGLFQYFTKSDGLPDNEFNTFSAFKSPTGQLFFGTVNGLTSFFSKDLSVDSKPPAVRFTGLSINGEAVLPRDSSGILAEDIAFLKRLDLPFSKNSIVLSFAATDFTSPERNQFAYYLRGAEAEWAHRGFEHAAQYLNLEPGEYEFLVKAANSNGVWNDAPISIKIVVAPPFYRTWLAYLFYLGLVGGVLFYFYKNQLSQKLEHAEAERLKSLDAFKSRFFTNITHEFRTPLTVILGVTDQLEKGETDDQKRDKHGLVKRSGENLLRLINQILDLAKLESSELKMNYVQGDVLAYLRYIAESLHSLANAQNLMLRVESDRPKIVLDYDPERLLQVVYNLLSNAVKFTPSGGKIVLRAFLAEKWLKISVSDTGAGIAADELPFIFDRFFQAKNQEQATTFPLGRGGAGIGLSLTRELVQAMGGDISVESTVGAGAAFLVKLPVTNAAEMDRETRSPFFETDQKKAKTTVDRAADSASPLVLLIEDNPDVVEYLTACLGEKYRLDFAFNGRAGIEKALETVPDLIVSDVMMPEKDGFGVCDFLKNDPRTSHVPIILLTAKATAKDRIAGLRRGADAYLAKPFQEAELLVWVEQLIAQRQVLRAKYSISELSVAASESQNPASEMDLEAAFIQKIRAVLETNFADSDFSADALCAKMEMPRIPLHRKLHALTGHSIVEQINVFRLEKGRALLLGGAVNVSEAAFQVGFNDPKYFTRLFTKTYGHAPKDVRKMVF